MTTNRSDKRLVWIDCEMTGLDPNRDRLLEIATIITDYDLHTIATGPVLAIRQTPAVLRRMDAWNRRTHKASGLLERVRTEGVSVAVAEKQTLAFVKKHCLAGTSPLCGNSVWQDKQFLTKYMPHLIAFLHYRIVDVSSIKTMAAQWYGERYSSPPKRERHLALEDIEDSIAELAHYRRTFFVE